MKKKANPKKTASSKEPASKKNIEEKSPPGRKAFPVVGIGSSAGGLKALRQGKEHYRSLFDNMLNGLAYCKMLFEQDHPVDFVYLTVNRAFKNLTGLKNVTGKRVSEVIPGIRESDPELFERYGRVALSGIPERFETYVEALGMWFAISVYSPQKEYFVAVFDNITDRKQAEITMLTRLRLLKFAESHSLEEFTQATLDESEALTGSTIGFYHLVETDQRTLSLQSWSTNTLQHMCTAEGKGQHYEIAEAGVWVDCVHQRRPVIHNNYDALPHRKGMPPGHAPVMRELVVPISRANKIVAIIGVGNKPSDYDERDVEMVSLLGDLSWDIAERKRAEEALRWAHNELEQRVVERTADLRHTVEQLLWEIEERQQAEEALRESEKKLRTLTSQLLTAQEEERKRLSRELHDSLGQTLLVLKLRMRAIAKRLRPDQQTLRQESEQTMRHIDRVIEDVRRLARNLSPSVLEDFGLAVALRNLCEEFSRHQNLNLSLDMDDISGSFSPEAQSHIYRIFQESLTNIGKYSQDCRVSLTIKRQDGGLAFVIEDDGIGFQLEEVQAREGAERAMGLATMAERVRLLGGILKLESKPGKWTRLHFTIPGSNQKL